jgi:adenosylcobinamide-GDP ribazoletransferase
VKKPLAGFPAALSYFTILPLGRFVPAAPPDARTLAWLPAVGALTGAFSGAIGLCAWELSHRMLWAALAAWIASIVVTGAIHVDGFLDSCDGLLVTASPQRRLEILRDPHHGTFALTGMAMLSALWIAALFRLNPLALPLVLAASEALARLAALICIRVFPYARADGTIGGMGARPSATAGALSALLVIGLAAWAGPPMLLALVAVPAAAIVAGWWASRRLGGGLTGDVYGAVIVAGNVIALLTAGIRPAP